jgi:hypothetical protein
MWIPRVKITCGICGKVFTEQGARYKTRMEKSKSGKLFCSIKCYTEYQRSEAGRDMVRKPK